MGVSSTKVSRLHLRVVESKDVVKHEEAVVLGDQVEDLGVSLSVLLLINKELASDHDNNVTASRRGRLGIEGGDAVADLLERQRDELLNNALGALDLRGLKGEHGRVTVKVTELRTVSVKLLVVKGGKLLSNGLEIDGHYGM